MESAIIFQRTELDEIWKVISSIQIAVNALLEKKEYNPNELLTSKQVMEILHISSRTWQTYRDRKVIPFVQRGRKIYVRRKDLDDYIESKIIGRKEKKKAMSCADSSCKNCNGVCDTEQSLCTINSQMATSYGGGFNWPSNPAIDVPIVKVWTAAAWNQLKAAIDAAYAAGSECSSQGEDFGANTMPTVSQNQPITADIYNKAII